MEHYYYSHREKIILHPVQDQLLVGSILPLEDILHCIADESIELFPVESPSYTRRSHLRLTVAKKSGITYTELRKKFTIIKAPFIYPVYQDRETFMYVTDEIALGVKEVADIEQLIQKYDLTIRIQKKLNLLVTIVGSDNCAIIEVANKLIDAGASYALPNFIRSIPISNL